MFSLILIVLTGLGIALFAQQNTQTVQVAVGSYFFPSIPVYLIVIASMLFGLVLAWILSVMNFFSTSLLLRQKDGAIQDARKRTTSLEREVTELREENARLRGEPHGIHDEAPSGPVQPNLIERVRERLAISRRKEALT